MKRTVLLTTSDSRSMPGRAPGEHEREHDVGGGDEHDHQTHARRRARSRIPRRHRSGSSPSSQARSCARRPVRPTGSAAAPARRLGRARTGRPTLWAWVGAIGGCAGSGAAVAAVGGASALSLLVVAPVAGGQEHVDPDPGPAVAVPAPGEAQDQPVRGPEERRRLRPTQRLRRRPLRPRTASPSTPRR